MYSPALLVLWTGAWEMSSPNLGVTLGTLGVGALGLGCLRL